MTPAGPAPAPSASTRLVALLGDPVAHSRSPALHNAAFRADGLDLVYVACRVAPPDLPAAVAGLYALGALGANVTVPHKTAVVPLVAALAPAARAIGAVNTLVRRDDGWLGDNTDAVGFMEPLAPHLDELRGAEAVILGAGGAARAAAYALLTAARPARLTLAARRPTQAEALARDLAPLDADGALTVRPLADAAPAVRAARLVVNATSIGMAGAGTEATPWPAATDFGPALVVYDLVYAPARTRLLREAAARGAATIGGLGMLVGQAAAAYALWTGRPFPPAVAHAFLADAALPVSP